MGSVLVSIAPIKETQECLVLARVSSTAGRYLSVRELAAHGQKMKHTIKNRRDESAV